MRRSPSSMCARRSAPTPRWRVGSRCGRGGWSARRSCRRSGSPSTATRWPGSSSAAPATSRRWASCSQGSPNATRSAWPHWAWLLESDHAGASPAAACTGHEGDQHRRNDDGEDELDQRAGADGVRDEAAGQCTHDAEQDRHEDADRVAARDDEARDRADDETGDDQPENQHAGHMPALERSEADAAAFALGDLDVGELVGGDDDAPALLVGECHGRRTVLESCVDSLLDVVHALVAVEGELARGPLDADPDLHATDTSR